MKADLIVGIQWGDEGKGKIVDKLASIYIFWYNFVSKFCTLFVKSGFLGYFLQFLCKS